jgi:hypothetical protein
MQDSQYEQRDDEIVEISDLPQEGIPSLKKRGQTRSLSGLLFLLQWSRQHRLFSALLTVSLVGLALLMLLGSVLPLQQIQGGKGSRASQTSAPLTGSDLFYFSPLPSWGTVELDEQLLAHVPVPIVGNEPPLRLRHGRHVLEWQAAPFEPQRCILLVPPQQGTGQTCTITPAPSTAFAEHASLITFPVSLAQLPEKERTALIHAAQALLDTLQSTEVVQPGERYMLAEGSSRVQTATTSLQATLHFFLDTDTRVPVTCSGLSLGEGCTISGQDCRLFCTPLWPRTPGPAWDIAAIFHTTWQYTTPDGQPLAGSSSAQGAAISAQFVTLHVTWTGEQWQVAFQNQVASSFDDPICVATIAQVGANPSYQSVPGSSTPLSWTYTSAYTAAGGCLAATQGEQAVNALLLQRFGVLLAANPEAHRLWPSLPVADSYEQQLAQHLLLVHGTCSFPFCVWACHCG